MIFIHVWWLGDDPIVTRVTVSMMMLKTSHTDKDHDDPIISGKVHPPSDAWGNRIHIRINSNTDPNTEWKIMLPEQMPEDIVMVPLSHGPCWREATLQYSSVMISTPTITEHNWWIQVQVLSKTRALWQRTIAQKGDSHSTLGRSHYRLNWTMRHEILWQTSPI